MRLILGHCQLNQHEHLVHKTNQTKLRSCAKLPETVEHCLLHCEQYQTQRCTLLQNVTQIINKHFPKFDPIDLCDLMFNNNNV